MKILLVTGSARRGSTNTATLRTAAELAPPGVTTVMYDGIGGRSSGWPELRPATRRWAS